MRFQIRINLLSNFYQCFYKAKIMRLVANARQKEDIDEEWNRLFRLAAIDKPSEHTLRVLQSFLSDRIQLLKKAEKAEETSTTILLCVEKNSLIYLRRFLPYYRELGIRHFVFIDNNSNDGSREYLMNEGDVTLYAAPYPFEHHAKVGWLLQAVQEIGTERRYLRIDSDEFLTWDGIEKMSFDDLLAKMKNRGMKTIRAIMVDMYPSWSLLDDSHEDFLFLEEFVFFDGKHDSYYLDSRTGRIYGGMRNRVMNTHLRMDKYVLFCPKDGQIPVNNHDITGVETEAERLCRCALRHYKFLPSEKKKYHNISKDRQSGYSEYDEVAKYGKIVDNSTSAFSNDSVRYDSSKSLRNLDIIKPI